MLLVTRLTSYGPGGSSSTVCNITELPDKTRQLIAASLRGERFASTSELQLHEGLVRGAADSSVLLRCHPG